MATIGDSSQETVEAQSSEPRVKKDSLRKYFELIFLDKTKIQKNYCPKIDKAPSRAASPSAATAAQGPSEAGKVFISYVVLGVFGVSFVLVTVALGLLVSLVNNPTCDESVNVRVDRLKRELFENNDQLTILKKLMNEPKGQYSIFIYCK